MKNYEKNIHRQIGMFLLVISLTVPWADAAENLLTNPGFEYGNTSGWTTWGCTLTATGQQVHTGNYSVLVSNRSQSWQGPVQSLLGKMESGKTYTISGWVRLQNADSDRIGITVSQTDLNDTNYHGISWLTGHSDRWIQLSGNFTLNVTGYLSALDVYFEGPAPGVNFYVDDVEIVAVEPPEPAKPEATGSVNIGTVYQELEGFGASGAWYEGWLTNHPKKNEIYDCLFGQLGLDIYRLRNIYRLDDDWSGWLTDTSEIIQAAEVSLGHPLKIMISSWSPPAYLKSNGNVAGATLARYPDGSYQYDKFAQWWADSLAEYKRRGIDVDYVNIQNEPEFLAGYDSCKFAPAETSEWAGYNLAFEAVYRELASRMTNMPKLLASDSFGCGASWAFIDELIDPGHVYGYAHHLYADGDYDDPDSFIPTMQSFASNYGDKPFFQTEYSCLCDVRPFSIALNLARHMHNSLVHEGVCSFCYWDLFWGDEGGLVTLDNPWQPNPGYTINHIYYAFKQYSAFTDPGWHRVEASTDSTGLRISAFISPDSTELTIVIINVSEIDIDLTLSLGGFLPEISSVYRTSETENAAYIGSFNPSQPLTLPPQTITTVSLMGSYSPPLVEDFEQGDFSNFNWSFSGDADWFITSGQSNSGSYSARAGDIEDGESSTLTVELDCVSGNISFYRKVSSESGFDCHTFLIDGTEQDRWSGSVDWGEVTFPVTAGRRIFEWVYSKDSSVSDGDDTAWIDDITFPR